jgi:hypothetical protein
MVDLVKSLVKTKSEQMQNKYIAISYPMFYVGLTNTDRRPPGKVLVKAVLSLIYAWSNQW